MDKTIKLFYIMTKFIDHMISFSKRDRECEPVFSPTLRIIKNLFNSSRIANFGLELNLKLYKLSKAKKRLDEN